MIDFTAIAQDYSHLYAANGYTVYQVATALESAHKAGGAGHLHQGLAVVYYAAVKHGSL